MMRWDGAYMNLTHLMDCSLDAACSVAFLNRVPRRFPLALSRRRVTPLPRQHPRLENTSLMGCIVRQDFHCAVLEDALGQEGADQCLSFHPNGLAVVQLAPTHPAVAGDDR